MDLALTDEQRFLAENAERLFAERSPAARVRALRGDPVGFDWGLWREMAELGWVGCHVPEAHGGTGLGFFELCLLLEAAGRTLVPEPLFTAAVLGAETLQLAGTNAQQARWLPRIASGEAVVTLAHQERGSRHDPFRITTRAERTGDGFALAGEKAQVPDGHVAHAFVVPVRTRGEASDRDGIGLALVPAGAPGLDVTRQTRIDGRGAALIRFDGVRVGEDAFLGPPDGGGDVLGRVLDRAAVALSAEMLGGASQAFDTTLAYLETRKQFGVPIGSFQALQHRAARMFVELELARSSVLAAARAVDEGAEEVARLASLAKARASETFVHVTNEAVQMHGGIGVTDEHDIGLYLKRARACDATFGDAPWHRRRWATLAGY